MLWYLDGGVMPFYPTLPVTYGSFFVQSPIAPDEVFALAISVRVGNNHLHSIAALFYRPIVTPVWLLMGLAGTTIFTRSLHKT